MTLKRQFLFRNYWWIAIVGALVALMLIFWRLPHQSVTLVGSVVATALAFCYFVQQQKLSETLLFKSLFTEFNIRYDEFNADLMRISQSDRITLSDEERLVDYFNLCAEEFLFYSEGYIHEVVWRSWCRGMMFYLSHQKIREIWDRERQSDSYYGLSLKIISDGACIAKDSEG